MLPQNKSLLQVIFVDMTKDQSTTNNGLTGDFCCEKCLNLEAQLQEVLEELSSPHLIIELIKNEHNQNTSLNQDNTSHNIPS
jgi:hypothetical protein